MAQAAGHDINYISLTGALFATGRRGQRPVPALNLIGDMGGGGMLLVNGVLAALLESSQSGKGQVLDVAMVDGAAQLMWMMHGFEAVGAWDASQREANMLDGAAHFYDTYECACGGYVSIGSIEPQFYALLLELAELDKATFADQNNQALWPELKAKLKDVFMAKTRDEWCAIMEGTDVCFAPVLSFKEAPLHHANIARQVYQEVDGVVQPAPAPRFSRTPSEIRHGAHGIGEDTVSVLQAMGFGAEEIELLKNNNSVA